MPSYKDKSGKWYVKFYYTDHQGKRKQKLKRGFDLKRQADEFERNFLTDIESTRKLDDDLLLPFDKFVDIFLIHKRQINAASSNQTDKYTFKNHIYGAFQKPISEITKPELQNWTNSLVNKDMGLVQIRKIYIAMRSVFNYAERVYGLTPNPVKGLIPPKKREAPTEMQFWTIKEFKTAIQAISDIKARTAITVLFYTGLRKGELYALTWDDYQGDYISIDKSLQKIEGEIVVTPPKTMSSIRKILMPSQVKDALNTWRPYTTGERIFEWEKRFIEKGIQEAHEKTGVKRIRVHDLRHSHASYLISKGANIELISKRLGHAKTSMTMDIYGHLYPSDEIKLIHLIESE